MYIGRFVVVGRTERGAWYLGYRVSSRSFPNRLIRRIGDRAVVLPTPDAPPSDNPYIAYNCLRTHQGTVIVANGSHADPIIEKVQLGYPLRDALALTLLALDYEHDQLNTPRIAAGLDARSEGAYLAIVAEDRLVVQWMDVAPGQAYLVATYELNAPTAIELAGESAPELCDAIFSSEYKHPVAALAVRLEGDELEIAIRSAREA